LAVGRVGRGGCGRRAPVFMVRIKYAHAGRREYFEKEQSNS